MPSLLNLKNLAMDALNANQPTGGQILDISGCQSVAIEADIEDASPANTTFNNGTSEISLLTYATKASSTAGDYAVVYDTAGLAWATALNKSGSDPAPTGAVYAAIASARKANVDISGATTAANVAALIRTAFLALASFPMTIVDNSNGTLSVTVTLHGNVTNAAVHNADDSGAGSITAAVTTPGTATQVDTSTETITDVAHGYSTGQKVTLTTTGTLPAGLSLATPYYLIVLTADTFQFATSLALALAGTPVNITTQGSTAGVNTVVVSALAGTLILQTAINPLAATNPSGVEWFDLETETLADESNFLFGLSSAVPPVGRFVRIYANVTGGAVSIAGFALGKGIV